MLYKSVGGFSDAETPKTLHSGSHPQSQPIVGAFIQLYYFVVGVGAIPIRFFLRERMGERSISVLGFIVSFIVLIVYVGYYIYILSGVGFLGVMSFFEDTEIEELSNSMIVFIVAVFLINPFVFFLIEVYLIKGKKHFKRLVENARTNKIYKHSYYRGDGKHFEHYQGKEITTILGKFTGNDLTIRMLVEPKKVAWRGFWLFTVSLIVTFVLIIIPPIWLKPLTITSLSFACIGVILVVGALCLFLEEFGIYMRVRAAALDMIDGEFDIKEVMEMKDQFKQSSTKINNSNDFDIYEEVSIVSIVKN